MAFPRLVLVALLLSACAEGGRTEGPFPGFDTGTVDDDASAPGDSGAANDSATPPVDAGGPRTCPAGRHACGAGCVDDLENLPANGCRLGCGEPCSTPPDGTASCDEAGRCSVSTCTPRTCEDAGLMCGAADDGCGTPLDCGACAGGTACTDGVCGCTPGPEEPNDVRFMAPSIASLTDSPDSNEVFSLYSLHSTADEDWFEASIADDFDAGNPQITVTLRNVPAGDDYDLAAYFVCDSGGDASDCTRGMPDNMIGHGCVSATGGAGGSESVQIATECSGTDEGGALVIHITSATFSGACANYEFEIDVH